ncbi:MAG TPA: HAMP domain-containing sensor histidine kinase [Planctomycetaceae bacterium]|nr:HAMP domain-containing sensor histidine kinase [Planctomycetaceae bacterium]
MAPPNGVRVSDPDEFRRSPGPRMNELEDAKLRALVEFAAGAGHEINNPVATIVGYVQQLLADETDPDRRHILATIGGQAYRIRDMIGDLMLFARPPQPRPEPLELAAVCREVAGKFTTDAAAIGCGMEINAPADAPIFADPIQLRVVISALLRNSLEAVGSNGRIVVAVPTVEEAGRQWAVLRISDNGRGLSDVDREHLFDPFYSGRQAGRGLGFGLPKAWRIVTLHGGRIDVESPAEGGAGAAFTIHWPAAAPHTG